MSIKIGKLTDKHIRELGRHILAGAFDINENGHVLVPKMGAGFFGSYRTLVNGQDPRMEANLFTLQGLLDILLVYFKQGAATPTFYLAPFSGAVTPLDTWTNINFSSAATELTTQYSQPTRVAVNFATPTTPSITNAASVSVFTIAAVVDIYGMGLLTVNTKGSTSGKLISAGLFDNPRENLAIGDQLSVEYVVDALDGSTP